MGSVVSQADPAGVWRRRLSPPFCSHRQTRLNGLAQLRAHAASQLVGQDLVGAGLDAGEDLADHFGGNSFRTIGKVGMSVSTSPT